MSDDYVIKWDKEFAEDIKTLASFFLKETPTLWPDLFSRLATDPASFEDGDDEYDMEDVLYCSGGDLGNRELVQAFMQVLRGECLIEIIDWKGEDEEGQLATFAAGRFFQLTKDFVIADALKELLLEITQTDEIDKVCGAGDRYVDEVFERIQHILNVHGFQIANLNEGHDAYSVFVLPMADYEKIENFKTHWLEVQDFLS